LLVSEAIHSRRYELLLTLVAALFVMLISATLLYLVEGPLQPDKFGSIPRALWWSVVTLTTIGYGDVYPESPLGRVLAACTAVTGVGLIAAPAGILAGAFNDAIQRRRESEPDA
jgi:voltage-gated potassium channel